MSVRNTAKAAHSLKELSIDWLIQTLCFLHAFLMSTSSQWLTEVKDKNFIQQTEDSQIRIAVQYYDSIKDIPMQAKSYYYWGCIRRDQNNHPEALKKFFTAITHAQSISDFMP